MRARTEKAAGRVAGRMGAKEPSSAPKDPAAKELFASAFSSDARHPRKLNIESRLITPQKNPGRTLQNVLNRRRRTVFEDGPAYVGGGFVSRPVPVSRPACSNGLHRLGVAARRRNSAVIRATRCHRSAGDWHRRGTEKGSPYIDRHSEKRQAWTDCKAADHAPGCRCVPRARGRRRLDTPAGSPCVF